MKISILGAGIVGRLLAFQLSRIDVNFNISVFEKEKENSKTCSFISGGMLSPSCELANCEKIISDLGIESIELWKKIIKDINYPIFFSKQGTLVIAHKNDESDLYIFKKNIDYKLNSESLYKILNSSSEIARLEPNIEKKFHYGLFFQNEGQIDNRDVLNGLLYELNKNSNIKLHFECSAEIINNSQIKTQYDEIIDFDLLFDCRGLGDTELKELRSIRGEIITFQISKIKLYRPIRLIHPRFPLYIIPRADNKFLIGATSIESNNNCEITIRSTLELLSAVFSINSQFGEANILELNSQLRPTFYDHKPKILFSKSKTIFKINGLSRHGFLISPKLIELVLQFALYNKIEEQYRELFYELKTFL